MESEQKTEELIKEFMRRTISRGNFDEFDLAIEAQANWGFKTDEELINLANEVFNETD